MAAVQMMPEGPLKKQRTDLPADPSLFPAGPQAGEASMPAMRKTKPCAKFFSVHGCPYWSGCNFAHVAPPGTNPASLASLGATVGRNMDQSGGAYNPFGAAQQGPGGMRDPAENAAKRKTKLCNKFLTPTGCPFGDRCNFAHGDTEIQAQKPVMPVAGGQKRTYGDMYGGQQDMYGAMGISAATASATMTIRADAVGVVIGKGGSNVRQINQVSGARVKIVEPDDPSSTTRTIEMQGTVEQIQTAQHLVQAFVAQFQAQSSMGGAAMGMGGPRGNPNNFKTKLCENFARGSCTYNERCHFAHGEAEMRAADGSAPLMAATPAAPQTAASAAAAYDAQVMAASIGPQMM